MKKVLLFNLIVFLTACSGNHSLNDDPDLLTIEWQTIDNSNVYRYIHEATLLDDGRVLVTGSYINETATEIFDPSSLVWQNIAPMSVGRSSHQAVKLKNGKVLVIGGYTKIQGRVNEIISRSNSSELFDPDTGTWEMVDAMNEGRSAFSATLLDNGSVLVAGGFGENLSVNTAEIFDVSEGKWRNVSPLNHKRALHQAVKLNDGRVLFIGGSSAEEKCEIFDPETETFTVVAPMNHARSFHRAVLMNDGRVLVSGGGRLNSAEIFDPVTENWTEIDSMSIPRSEHSMTLLPDGKVLVTGGNGPLDTTQGIYPTPILQSSTEIYDPETNIWTTAAPLKTARLSHTVTILNSNQLLVVGGGQGNNNRSVELSNSLIE